MKLRIMSFNTQHCLNCQTNRIDFKAFARVINDLGADIVGLQEIRGIGRNREEYDDQTGILAELTGMHGYFARAISFGGVDPFGNALLSRYPIENVSVIPIPDPEVRRFKGYYETRCVLKAKISAEGGLNVLVSHFGLNPDEHENAVETVEKVIDSAGTVLMGDFNMRPDNPLLDPVRAKLTDTACRFDAWENGFTFPSWKPDKKIDYIFTSGDVNVIRAEIPACVVSDHRPYVADIEI